MNPPGQGRRPRPDTFKHPRGVTRFYPTTPWPSRFLVIVLVALAIMALYALNMISNSPHRKATYDSSGHGLTERFLERLESNRPEHERVLRSGTSQPGAPLALDLSVEAADGNRLSFTCAGAGGVELLTTDDEQASDRRPLTCGEAVHTVRADRPLRIVLTPLANARISWALVVDPLQEEELGAISRATEGRPAQVPA